MMRPIENLEVQNSLGEPIGKDMGESAFEKNKFTIFILIVLSSIGIGTSLFISSKWGIGISPDSAVYVNAARNVVNGQGLKTFSSLGGTVVSASGDSPKLAHLKYFPPLYPLLLSSLGICGVEPLSGARWIAALLFGGNILIIGLIIYRMNHSFWFAMFGSLLILLSQDMIQIHSFAWSDPPFIFFGFLGLYFLGSYLTAQKLLHLIYSAGAISLAFLTRYIGLSLVIAGVIGILCFSGERYRRKIIHSAIFGFVSCLPIGLWVIRNLYLGQSATNREIYFHPVTYGVLKSGLFDVCSWILPYRVPTALKLIFLVVMVMAFLLIDAKTKEEASKESEAVKDKIFHSKISGLLGVFITFYLAVLLISISFFDASLPIHGRYLSPIYASLVIVLVDKISRLLIFLRKFRVLERGLILMCIGFLVFSVCRALVAVSVQYENGAYSYENKFNYNNRFWHQSEIIREIENMSSETVLYTNVPDAIYVLAGRSSYKIPAKENYMNKKINSKYLFDLESMGRDISGQNGLLIYFSMIQIGNLPTEEELREKLPLILEKSLKDGSIYRAQTWSKALEQ